MNKETVNNFVKGAKSFAVKRSPEILTGIGIAGMITTTVLAVKATPKALKLIEDAQYEKENQVEDFDESRLTTPEKIKTCWKCYIPAVVTGATSIACLIGSSRVNMKRNTALATAYNISQTALTEYRDKVVETIGEKKETVIREKVAQKKADENPASKSEIFIAGSGDVLFLDPISMRYFTSDIENIRKIVNDINYRMVSGMEEFICLSEFYDEIGLQPTSTSDDVGWNLGRDGQISVDYRACVADNGKPCLMLEYNVNPRYDYHKLS